MSSYQAQGQAVLFVKTVAPFWGIVGTIGDLAADEAREYGNLEDCGVSCRQLPEPPGIYVWEGEIWIETGGNFGGEPIDPDVDWRGAWRPARLADLRRFGMTGAEFLFPGPLGAAEQAGQR